MSARSARRPVPALVFLLALAILAVVVWVRVADRDSAADTGGGGACTAVTVLPANASVPIGVLNGTDRSGLAATALAAFAQIGFPQGSTGNAEQLQDGVGIITAGPNGALSAKLVHYYLPGATLETDGREDVGVTITLGAQFTEFTGPAAVADAIAKAGLTQQAPPAPGGTPSPVPTSSCAPGS